MSCLAMSCKVCLRRSLSATGTCLEACCTGIILRSSRIWYSPSSLPTPSLKTLGYFLTSCSFDMGLGALRVYTVSPMLGMFSASLSRCMSRFSSQRRLSFPTMGECWCSRLACSPVGIWNPHTIPEWVQCPPLGVRHLHRLWSVSLLGSHAPAWNHLWLSCTERLMGITMHWAPVSTWKRRQLPDSSFSVTNCESSKCTADTRVWNTSSASSSMALMDLPCSRSNHHNTWLQNGLACGTCCKSCPYAGQSSFWWYSCLQPQFQHSRVGLLSCGLSMELYLCSWCDLTALTVAPKLSMWPTTFICAIMLSAARQISSVLERVRID